MREDFEKQFVDKKQMRAHKAGKEEKDASPYREKTDCDYDYYQSS